MKSNNLRCDFYLSFFGLKKYVMTLRRRKKLFSYNKQGPARYSYLNPIPHVVLQATLLKPTTETHRKFV
jgi:hypothetical protein